MSTSAPSPKRGFPIKRALRVLICVYGVWLLLQLWPVDLKPGPQTTVVLGPLRPNGTVDYAEALNEECSAGVTLENNAAVPLLQALGPDVIDRFIRLAYFERLGMPLQLEETTAFQPLEKMFGDDRRTLERVFGEMDQALRAPWSGTDHPELARWLAVNADVLQLCLLASQRDRYFDPLIPPAEGTLLETKNNLSQETRSLARLLAVRITLQLGEGRVESALADTAALHRISRLVSQHPLFIQQLVAYSHSAMAIGGDAAIVQSGRLTAEQARRQRELLATLPPFPPLAGVLDHGERYATLDSLQGQSLAELQPNIVLKQVNAGFDQLVAAMECDSLQAQREAWVVAREKIKSPGALNWDDAGQLALVPRQTLAKQIGDRLTALSMTSIERMIQTQFREKMRGELADVGYALAQYRAIHGEFPETLELLLPEFLQEVPDDHFGNGPIRYVRSNAQGPILLYSVGENGIDDQGISLIGRRDDISFGTVPEL